MSAVLRHARAGALEPTRLFVRWRACAPTGEEELAAEEALAEAPLAPGELALGPFAARVEARVVDASAAWTVRVRSRSAAPVRLEALGLGFLWRAPHATQLRFLRQGFQSWSFAGSAALDEGGAPRFPSGAWLRGFHHATDEPPADRAGWHESDGVTVIGVAPSGSACALGVLERGHALGVVYARREGRAVRVEAEQRFERELAPGESVDAEPVRAALGGDASRLLEAHAEAHGAAAGARAHAPFQTGWCTWYHFFHGVREADFLRNLDALAAARREIPIDVVQLDDGYQREVGDWLETNAKFPSGLEPLAKAVRQAGFTAGIWTAPFCVVPASRPFERHPEWLLRDASSGAPLRGLHHAMWTPGGWVYVLDPTHPAVAAHLERSFRALAAMGFRYLKLDFLYTAALRARAHDPRATRAERLRRGLAAIRAGAGEDAFLLGCGCPLGPAVGVVDAMRIGPDTAPHWHPLEAARIPGLEPTVPSARNALRNTLARAWMHRRLWLNDPDCLLARSRDSGLSREEVRTLAVSLAVTGGMALFSDDVAALAPEDRALLRDALHLAGRVDRSGRVGTARAPALLAEEVAPAVVARADGDWLVAFFNGEDAPAARALDVSALAAADPLAVEPLLGSPPARAAGGALEIALPPRGSAVYRLRARPALAVFCDFDGTFAVQDVGSTLARRYAAERRAALWERLAHGELTAWEYNLELLDGLALPEEDLEAFLRTVELDPGARALVEWCERREIPFRVLSDGFDRNLDRIQALTGLRFAYDANHLHYENGAWRIEARHPDPRCACGTGTCKRGRIEAYRAEHPGVAVVHIGNGRVSDLCGAEAADWIFAKDTLAEELRARGVAFDSFATLHDVVARLEARLSARDDSVP